MLRKIAPFAVVIATLSGTPAVSQTAKEQDCVYQAQVVEAVRQARIARVSERKVADTIKAGNPSWPDKYSNAISLVAPWVYEMKMRDVKGKDLAGAWKEVCLSQ